MKVLVFTTLYPNNVWPNHGVFIRERMIHFAKLEGCSVKVVAPVPYFPAFKGNWRWRFSQVARWEVRDGLDVYHPRYIMTPKWGMFLYGVWMFLSVLPTVTRLRKLFDFDLIDAHFVYPDAFAAVLLGKYFHKPVVVSARGSDINVYSALPLIRSMLRYTLREAKTVIAVSQALKDAITALGIPGEKVVVVPNGVDTTKFYRTGKELSRSMLNLPAGRIILSVGNLTANKGVDLLIQAFSRVASDPLGQDLSLVVVGNGTMEGQLENLIHSMKLSDKVKLVGVVSHEKLNLWYNAADLFCLMSEKEGWPNVLLEALACGVPVVATAVGGIPEILCSDDLGMLTDREQGKIAESIRAAFATTWRADKLSEYAGKFSWDRIARRLQEIFQAALETENASNNVEPHGDDATTRGLITRKAPVDSVSEARRINLP